MQISEFHLGLILGSCLVNFIASVLIYAKLSVLARDQRIVRNRVLNDQTADDGGI